jgi:hypothetical protein
MSDRRCVTFYILRAPHHQVNARVPKLRGTDVDSRRPASGTARRLEPESLADRVPQCGR